MSMTMGTSTQTSSSVLLPIVGVVQKSPAMLFPKALLWAHMVRKVRSKVHTKGIRHRLLVVDIFMGRWLSRLGVKHTANHPSLEFLEMYPIMVLSIIVILVFAMAQARSSSVILNKVLVSNSLCPSQCLMGTATSPSNVTISKVTVNKVILNVYQSSNIGSQFVIGVMIGGHAQCVTTMFYLSSIGATSVDVIQGPFLSLVYLLWSFLRRFTSHNLLMLLPITFVTQSL